MALKFDYGLVCYSIPTRDYILSIARLERASEFQRAIEARCIHAVKNTAETLIAEYKSRHKTQIGTDLAREIFPDYAGTIEEKLVAAPAVQKSAAALADMVFDSILATSHGGSVLFTAGGTGSGKTTAILSNIDTFEAFKDASLIFDGNFNSKNSSKERVERALRASCSVAIIFVHRHPVEAYVKGVLPRAQLQGRTVAVSDHIRLHRDSIKTFLYASRAYKDNKKVSFAVLNNTGSVHESYPVPVDYLKSVKYDSDELTVAITAELNNAQQKGSISQALYEASR